MYHRFLFLLTALSAGAPAGFAQSPAISWQTIENKSFTLHFTAPDTDILPVLVQTLEQGAATNAAFFERPFPQRFDVWCFPDRALLDRQWQQDWGDSTFQSACWMVASGVAKRLDLLSPRMWEAQACEHRSPFLAADSAAYARRMDEFRRLLTHELTHVFHGQHCRIPDFTGMDALGWWVEGLATYVSGQLDSARIERVRTLLREGKAPAGLDQFWSGPNRYGLSGSVVAALDARYGRAMLLRLLPLTTPAEVFETLGANEAELLTYWKHWFENR